MATLTGQQIKDTYDGLLKTQNSTAGLPASGITQIQDGVGNNSALQLGRIGNGAEIDGNFTVTGDADLNTIKVNSQNPTISKLVDEADGIANNDNDTSIPTSAAIKDYVDNATPTVTKFQHMHGLVNNLASQGSGGFDFMEWTSNATPETQVPAIVALQDLKLVKVGAVWLGSNALSLQTNEQVAFTLRKLTAGSSSVIGNYTNLGSLFTIDQTDSGTYYNTNITLSTPINVSAGDIIACIGQETGTVTPNTGELSISFLFEEV